MGRDTSRTDLDNIDRSIVAMLQDNGRVASLEIARQLGIAEATVRKRLARLLDEGIIRVTATVNPSALGYTVRSLIGIRVELSHLNEAARRIAAMPHVRSVSIITGTYDLLPVCHPKQAI